MVLLFAPNPAAGGNCVSPCLGSFAGGCEATALKMCARQWGRGL